MAATRWRRRQMSLRGYDRLLPVLPEKELNGCSHDNFTIKVLVSVCSVAFGGGGDGGRLTQQDLHDNAPEIAFPCRREVGGFPDEIWCLSTQYQPLFYKLLVLAKQAKQIGLTTACTTYARSLPSATISALFSVSSEQISLIHVRISGPAPF